ncbi:MAG: S8 family peptidase [Anaerolineales bacterium]
MPNRIHKQKLITVLAILFPIFLLWSPGTAVVTSSTLQISETPSPTILDSEDIDQTETPDLRFITPSLTPITALSTDGSLTSETHLPTSVSSTPTSIPRPLPGIFTTGAYAADELIVRFKPTIRATRIHECLGGVDVQILSEIAELNSLVLRIGSGDLGQTYHHILACPGVMYVEPNFLLQAADTIPNDPSWGIQYGLINIRAPQGWDLTTGSTTVTIAIVDTGVDYGHIDLAGKLVPGYDFVNNDASAQDDNGHGTHVAGIAAASSNNGTGVAGVSWGAHIMPVKVLNSSGGGTYANTALGVIWAVDHGAQVINMSLGGTGPSSALADTINYAHSQGAVVVAAAGNTGSNFVLYPARYPNVIAVAKTNSTNNWDGSNYGPEIDIAAPGTLIFSTIVGGYDYKSGSSMSTGYVSGLAAILKGVAGNASPDVIESQMETTALDIEFAGWDEYTGAGLVQMDAAIQLAWPPKSTPVAQFSPIAGNENLPGQIAPTNTLIPTWTVSPTQPTATGTVTFSTEPSSATREPGTSTNTPIVKENEVEAQGQSASRNYFLPCAGILLIFLGLFLVWFFRRKNSSR